MGSMAHMSGYYPDLHSMTSQFMNPSMFGGSTVSAVSAAAAAGTMNPPLNLSHPSSAAIAASQGQF